MTDQPSNRIAELRNERGLSQAQLADKIGESTHWMTISKLERGKMKLTADWAIKIGRAFGIDYRAVFGSPAAGVQEAPSTGERLRVARQNAGFNFARSAAMKFSWTPSTYVSHENGQTPVPFEESQESARRFGVSPEWLLPGNRSAPENIISGTISGSLSGTKNVPTRHLEASALEFVRHVLRELDVSPSALAKKAGLSSTTLRRALNNPDHRFTLSLLSLQKIADASGISPAPFFGAANLRASAPKMRRATLRLPEGPATIEFPTELPPATAETLKEWFNLLKDLVGVGRPTNSGKLRQTPADTSK